MGLDTVELIMAIEDEFNIDIENQDASEIATVGDIYIYVLKKLNDRGSDAEFDEKIWERVKEVVVSQLGVNPEEVMKKSSIVYDLGAD